MKFRKNDWLNTTTREVSYGIDGFSEGEWLHIASDGKPLFFDTPEARDEKMKELRKRAKELGK